MTAISSPRARKALRRLAERVAGDADCVGPPTVARMVEECGGEVTEAEVTAALADMAVQVAELPTLPTAPPAELPTTLLETVHELGLRLSVQVVFTNELIGGIRVLHGFALDNGRGLDRAALVQAQQRVAAGPAGADRERRMAVLADLTAVAGTGDAPDRIVLWEVVRLLRGPAREGMSQLELKKQANLLAVHPDDAVVLAAALVEECRAAATPTPSTEPPEPAVPRPRATTVPGVPSPQPSTSAEATPQRTTAAPVRSDAAPPGPPLPGPPSPGLPPPGLAVRPGRAGSLHVIWSEPSTGTIELRRAADRPVWRRGTSITGGQLRGYGTAEPTSGAAPTSDGRMRTDVELPDERTFLTAFLRTADGAVVGDTVVLSRSEPVRDVQVRRFGEEVRLRWGWPDGAVAAVVTWTPDGGSPQARRCTRRAFFDGGGHPVAVAHEGGTVAVQAAYGYESAQVLAPPVEVAVPAAGVPVRYAIRPRSRRWPVGPRIDELQVTASVGCVLPDLVVVAGYGRRMPETPVDGVPVGRLSGRPVAAGETVAVPLDPAPDAPRWLVCLVDEGGLAPAGDEIVLLPHSYAELRRR